MVKILFRGMSAGAALIALVGVSLPAHAVVLYSSLAGAQTTQLTFTAPGQDPTDFPSSGNPEFGDDYYTGYNSITVNGLSFFGGLQASANTDHLTIDFYDTAGNRFASIQPTDSEDHGVALHTLSSDDFNQNGVQGITIPGSGYVMFTPITYSTGYIAPDGSTVVTPGDPRPMPFTLGFGQLATVGINYASHAGTIDSNGTFSAGQFANTVNQLAQFELTGTGIGTQTLIGDTNLDGHVDLTDLNAVLNNLGATTDLRSKGNFDGALTIDLTDLNDVLNNLGISAPSGSEVATAEALLATGQAPEPSTLSLLVLATPLFLHRRKPTPHM